MNVEKQIDDLHEALASTESELRDAREALASATHIIQRVAHQVLTERHLLPSLVSDVRAFLSRQDEIELAEYVASLTPEQRAENERITAKPEEIARINALREEALARVEAERESLMDTYVALAERLGIDLDSARKAPGKPSDVFVSYISGIQAQLAEALTLIRDAKEGLRTGPSYGWEDRLASQLGDFLARHAQAEQQEAQSPLAKIAESLRQKAADEWASHPSNPANQEAQGAQAEPANFGQELEAFEKWRHTQADSLRRCGYPEGADAFIRLGSVQWAGWQARAFLATQPSERECNCPKIGERFSAEKHGGPCPIHDAVRGAEHE